MVTIFIEVGVVLLILKFLEGVGISSPHYCHNQSKTEK